jgi:KUP system potassium uptake protein
LASHHEIDLPDDPNSWIVHVSLENLISAERSSVIDRIRFRLFALLRQVSQPAYYFYGLGDKVQLSAEIVPVRLG